MLHLRSGHSAEEPRTAVADILYNFGVKIGIAFQIQDDLLDAFGNPQKVGKKEGGDIILNKQTILRIHAWYRGGQKARDLLQKDFASEDIKVAEIRKLFENVGSRKYTEDLRDSYYQDALKDLSQVNGNADIKQELAQFAEWLILREH